MENQTLPLPSMLKYFRKKKKFTQAEIAEMLSISRSGYANFETGRVVPNIEHIVQLSSILDHDFLFAYGLSCKKEETFAELVCEDRIEYNAHASLARKLELLPESQISLIERYVDIMLCEDENE